MAGGVRLSSGAEFGEIVEDIREHGLVWPIVLDDGRILDGRCRYGARQHGWIERRFEGTRLPAVAGLGTSARPRSAATGAP